MSITNFPQGVSSFGFPQLGPLNLMTSGSVFWVNSATGTDADGRGSDPSRPLASLKFALGKTTSPSSNPTKPGNDVIILMPGHVESINSAAYFTTAASSVSIVGLGVGNERPTLQWKTTTTAQIIIATDGIRFYNVIFDLASQLTAMAEPIKITSTNTQFESCYFLQASAANAAVLAVGLEAGWGQVQFEDCTIDGSAAAGAEFIQINAAGSGLRIRNSRVIGNYTNSVVNAGAFNVLEVFLQYDVMTNIANNKPILAFGNAGTASQGFVHQCFFTGVAWTAIGPGANSPYSLGTNVSFYFAQSLALATANKSAVVAPALAVTI